MNTFTAECFVKNGIQKTIHRQYFLIGVDFWARFYARGAHVIKITRVYHDTGRIVWLPADHMYLFG